MRALILLVIVASVAISTTTAIPSEEEKDLESQTRQKRGGWGYEPSNYVVAPGQHLTVVAPQKTISTTSVVHAPVAATTTLVHQPAVVVPQSESYVWQSSPDVTYSLHQRHGPRYSYYSYPNSYPNYYPSYNYPSYNYPSYNYPSYYYPNYNYPTTTLLGHSPYLTSSPYYYSGWKK